MKNKVAKNYIYNLIYQIAILIIPLITAPYLARILGPKGIGVYSYNYSIAYYFGLFIMLGINNYGNRSIAKCLGDNDRINKTFCEIYPMQLIIGIVVFVIYMVYSLVLCEESLISFCYIPFIISYAMDVNWLFFGQENFKVVLWRNVIIKILTTIAIFTLVKDKSDVVIYILIMSFGALISQIIVWFIVVRTRKFIRVPFKDIWKHLKPNMILFIPVIAVSIYRTMDKIMLGNISNMTQVGYYENAEKIISILLSFITALGTVMLPRMSALYESNDKAQIRNMINNSVIFVSFAASAVSFGIILVSHDLVSIYYGKSYLESGYVLQLLCITIPFISYANIIRMQILVPQGKDFEYVLSCFLGAIVNLIINLLLIPTFQARGAAIGTIVAEFMVMIVQLISAKGEINIRDSVKNIIGFWFSGFIMYVVTKNFNFSSNVLLSLVIKVVVGFCVYMVVTIIRWKIFKDEYINTIVNKFVLKIKNKGKL